MSYKNKNWALCPMSLPVRHSDTYTYKMTMLGSNSSKGGLVSWEATVPSICTTRFLQLFSYYCAAMWAGRLFRMTQDNLSLETALCTAWPISPRHNFPLASFVYNVKLFIDPIRIQVFPKFFVRIDCKVTYTVPSTE